MEVPSARIFVCHGMVNIKLHHWEEHLRIVSVPDVGIEDYCDHDGWEKYKSWATGSPVIYASESMPIKSPISFEAG